MVKVRVPTREELEAASPERRLVQLQNARRTLENGNKDAQLVIDAILNSGLPLRSGGMSTTDPVYLRMEEIVWSAEGRQAAVAATDMGHPALAGVDPLLQKELRDQYHQHDMGTANAGYIVAELMRAMGYRENGSGKCPVSCRAKTGMKWIRRVK